LNNGKGGINTGYCICPNGKLYIVGQATNQLTEITEIDPLKEGDKVGPVCKCLDHQEFVAYKKNEESG